MTKKKTLVNERVIRRWGKLANMPALTENWLEEQDALEDEAEAAEDGDSRSRMEKCHISGKTSRSQEAIFTLTILLITAQVQAPDSHVCLDPTTTWIAL